ncbi:sulfite exporter TauE/SafE family protein [Metabacillus herbersteinensis]|uniref:Probable membrane transporter protein n=1 Tax=Metabacillus herbersteinensis TaxID=283816 RepID=A0ABV6GG76_9BACI
MLIVITMFILGTLFGFIGAGGAGFVIAILTTTFHVPIHIALGTSLAGMAFTSMSGAYSHYREGNTHIKIGLIVGVFAAIGSYIGAKIITLIPAHSLNLMTGGMLLLSSLLLLLNLFFIKNAPSQEMNDNYFLTWIKATLLGIVTGVLSGTFGIGSAPFIQIGLLVLFKLTVRQSVGTTMLIIIPTAVGGGIGYYSEGLINFSLLAQVLIGTMCGAYIGAKFTNLAPKTVLKTSIILTPAVGGVILLLI